MITQLKSTLQSALQSRGVEIRRSASGRRLFAKMRNRYEVEQIVYDTFFRDRAPGVMIEVGAARPDFLNQGAHFRARGWRVLSVEPNPRFAALHRARGHEIHQYACGDTDADGVEFCVVHAREDGEISNESYSSLSIKPEYGALNDNLDIEKIRVSVRRLDTILASNAPEIARIDCLAIDVEGWELEVLRGFNLERFAPRVIVVENLLRAQSYRDYMSERGYRLWGTIHPNEVYIKASPTSI